MSFSILKFGGTSMGSIQSIQNIQTIIEQKTEKNKPLVAVVSAMNQITDQLLFLANMAKKGEVDLLLFEKIQDRHLKTLKELSPKANLEFLKKLLAELKESLTNQIFINEIPTDIYQDYILSFGERLSASLLATSLQTKFGNVLFVDAREFVVTDNNFGNAKVDYNLSANKTKTFFTQNIAQVFVVTGFIARNLQGQTTTLGRGGSDFTAGLLANFLETKEVEIWTDVDGILSTDPRIVLDAKIVQFLSYREAFEVAYYGGKVLYPKTMEACQPKNINILIKNTFNSKAKGSIVKTESQVGIKVISRVKKVIVVEIVFAAITSDFGLLGKIFTWFGEYKIAIDVVATSGDSVSFSCDCKPPKSLTDKIKNEIGETTVWIDKEIVAVIGNDIANTASFNQILNHVQSYKPVIISMNTKQTNFTVVVEANQSENLVKEIHQLAFALKK